tara:strand:+ start:832 stop:1476 length:645 start_codon:yes stop_codon:yes gene_type:complete
MFKQNHYQVIRGVISPEMAELCYHYLLNKRRVFRFLHENRLVSPFNDHWGTTNDSQIPNTWSHYDDVLMATLLVDTKSKLEKEIDLKLVETYTYTRLYVYGDELKRHKDRPSCQISATMNLGGDPWPIFVDNTGGEGNVGTKVDLQPGDCLMYRGCELEHWREKFYGESCGQVFLHYNDASDPMAKENEYDGRPILGLPVSAMDYYKPKNENTE